MTKDDVIARLREAKRSEVAKGTGLRSMYLYRVERGLIKNPGSVQIDQLREYFEQQQKRT